MLSERNKKIIREHAFAEQPNECCGLIISFQGEDSVVKCKNVSNTPEKTFSICPSDYVKASRYGKIMATYHSHSSELDGLSEFDKFNSEVHKLSYILYCPENNTFIKYDPDCEFNSYIGRKFKIGKTDCFSLVKDFFEAELKITINDYSHLRDNNWRDRLEELFDKNYMNEGFVKVSDKHKKYDCHLFKYGKESASQHIGINLGGGLMLHQPYNGFSRIEKLTERHKKFISYTIRHKELL